MKVEEGSNEIEAIPRWLKMLQLAGCMVTIDAIGCQKEFTQLITERGGDYVLAVKQSQGHRQGGCRMLCVNGEVDRVAQLQKTCY